MGWKRGLGAKRGSCGVEKEGKEASVGRREDCKWCGALWRKT